MPRYSLKHAPPYTGALKIMDATQICNLMGRAMIKTTKRTKRESVKFPGFNSPFNINVATNVAKTFLTLIDKYFPKDKKIKQNLQ